MRLIVYPCRGRMHPMNLDVHYTWSCTCLFYRVLPVPSSLSTSSLLLSSKPFSAPIQISSKPSFSHLYDHQPQHEAFSSHPRGCPRPLRPVHGLLLLPPIQTLQTLVDHPGPSAGPGPSVLFPGPLSETKLPNTKLYSGRQPPPCVQQHQELCHQHRKHGQRGTQQ